MSVPQVSPEKLVEAMQQETEKYLQSVMQAVNAAADGAWIADSEEQVRDLSAEFRRQVFEKAMQLRINAAEAAFPPSAQSADGEATGQ
jgi:hypothetical protein